MNQDGTILNDPFQGMNVTPTFQITETNLTNLTKSDWVKIKDRSTENSTMKVNNGETVIVKSFINSYSPDV